MFAFLTVLLYRAVFGSFRLPLKKVTRVVFTIAFLYAVSDEIHQSFVPTRHGTVTDVAIDTFGILLVIYFFHKRIEEIQIDELKRS